MTMSDQLHNSRAKSFTHSSHRGASTAQFSVPEHPETEKGSEATKTLLLFLGLFLFYLIVMHSLPAGISETLPEAALALNRANPNAANVYVEEQIAALAEINRRDTSTPGDRDGKNKQFASNLIALKELLRHSISREPINPAAFRLLAQIAFLEGRPKTARQMMAEAASLSISETTAVAFMLGERLAADDPKAALGYTDLLMRSQSNLLAPIAQLVTRLAENPKAQQELVARLGAAPPWRKDVLSSFATSGLTKIDTPLILLTALKNTPHPPTEEEIGGYINLLLNWNLYPLAYSTWVRFLDVGRLNEVANLFNGSFERTPSGLPFDWVIGGNAATLAGIFTVPDNQNQSALFVRFGQVRSAFPTIRQTVVLAPGNYNFRGKIRGEILARRGLQWRVTCLGGNSAGESKMLVGRFPNWSNFSFEISVPDQACPAQTVELQHMARTPSEQTAAGEVWFDDLAITRCLLTLPAKVDSR